MRKPSNSSPRARAVDIAAMTELQGTIYSKAIGYTCVAPEPCKGDMADEIVSLRPGWHSFCPTFPFKSYNKHRIRGASDRTSYTLSIEFREESAKIESAHLRGRRAFSVRAFPTLCLPNILPKALNCPIRFEASLLASNNDLIVSSLFSYSGCVQKRIPLSLSLLLSAVEEVSLSSRIRMIRAAMFKQLPQPDCLG